MSMGSAVATNERIAVLIGRCVAVSTDVEVQLALTMGSLLGVENSASVAVFSTLRNARARRDALLAAASHALSGEMLEIFRAIMAIYERTDSIRNDIVHGVWGQISSVDDAALWCSSQNYAVWHISDYHKGQVGELTSGWRKEQWIKYVFIWHYQDIENAIQEISLLAKSILNFHACLRYYDQPAGSHARHQLDSDALVQKALKELRRPKKK